MVFRIAIVFVLSLIEYLAAAVLNYLEPPGEIWPPQHRPSVEWFHIAVVIPIVVFLGLPLLSQRIWPWSRKCFANPFVTTILGITLIVLGWLPESRTVPWNETRGLVEHPEGIRASMGWMLLLFGILWQPRFSLGREDRLI